MCLMPSNPDIAGIGVRIAIYLQNLLSFFPAFWAIWDWEVTDYELECAETQSTTGLVLAFAILISCIVQASTLGLTSYHATIVLCLSWMNNTNAFIYFLMYVHYKCQRANQQLVPTWSSWIDHVKGHIKAMFGHPAITDAQATADDPRTQTHDPEQAGVTAPYRDAGLQVGRAGKRDAKARVKVLFKRIALLLGSLHLTLMAVLGIWLWSNPRSFGIPDASCAVDLVHLAVVGARVPFGSNILRVASLVIYSLTLLPGVNLILPMAAFLGLYIWHNGRLASDSEGVSMPKTALGITGTGQSLRTRISKSYRTATKSPVLPIFLGLALLFAVNVIFIADIELTLHRNQGLQDDQETQWGFGQILAMLLVFLPLRDVVEMILARRLRRQEQQIKKHERAAAWSKAILRRDVGMLLELVQEGADPNVSVEDGWTALEVATVAQNWKAVHVLTTATPPADLAVKFHDGRTPVQVAAFNNDWESIRAFVGAKADVDMVDRDGQTALELAALEKRWAVVKGLVSAGADTNLTFRDGRTVLELAAKGQEWDMVQHLVEADANPNTIFKGLQPSTHHIRREDDEVTNISTALHAACHYRKHDLILLLLDRGANPNVIAHQATENEDSEGPLSASERELPSKWPLFPREKFIHGSAFHYVCSLDGGNARLLVEKSLDCGANPNLQASRPFSPQETPLQAAVLLDVVELLLERGADPNIRGGQYGFALQSACFLRQRDIVNILLDKGADPNSQGGAYGCALQAACATGAVDIVTVLLDKLADPNLQVNCDGL